MSTGFHRMGANVGGKLLGWSNAQLHANPNLPRPSLAQLTEAERAVVLEPSAEFVKVAASIPVLDVSEPERKKWLAGEWNDPFSPGLPKLDKSQARAAGYTGDQCTRCNSMRMKMAGHCMVCEDCGETTGCS